jgi:hypothetical protein
MALVNLRAFIYIVKNISATDKTAAEEELAHGTKTTQSGTDDYDIVRYNAAYTFDGTESYVAQLTYEEYEITSVSTIFVDYSSVAHMDMHNQIRPFGDNDRVFCGLLLDDLHVHLVQVMALTAPQRQGVYTDLQILLNCLITGDVDAAANYLGGFTGVTLQAATGVGTDVQWQLLLDHVGMMAGPFLEKFPR